MDSIFWYKPKHIRNKMEDEKHITCDTVDAKEQKGKHHLQ